MHLRIGLDIGSTTAKIAVLDKKNDIIFKSYKRHFSDIKNTTLNLLKSVKQKFPQANLKINLSGSSGIGISEKVDLPFIQEVIACTEAVKLSHPNIDVIIELGGEDAKLIYLTNGLEQRMNDACAGGTGAFIDQIASLLNTDATGLNELAKGAEKIYPIASRCGVFAKTDIQPLINEGVRREDIAASVFQAVVNQTISGLACGRPIKGNVAFLGGPLTFLDQLRYRFFKTLKLTDEEIAFSEDGHYYVAIGAALESNHNQQIHDIDEIIQRLQEFKHTKVENTAGNAVLFNSEEEYNEFLNRHHQAKVATGDLANYQGNTFLGIDAGSTTTKMILLGDHNEVLYRFYDRNHGDPLETVRKSLVDLYQKLPEDVFINRTAVTGYGEKLIEAGFEIDDGIIETVAHYTGAQQFQPDVNFVLDIGGQDMKCIKIKDGVIDSIVLNEACSSGCGSFLENFSDTLGYDVRDFSKMALFAENPVDLGSRCTVFMNSKVRQVQKEGASIADISAGLAYSVVMNALYKVIKLKSVEELGDKIVVQGGTFLNDAVLRSFENLIGREVIRPDLAGLMGAFGSALIAKRNWEEGTKSTITPLEELHELKVTTSHSRCRQCEMNCPLTITKFPNRRIFITGNRCERGAGMQKVKNSMPNLVNEKLDKLFNRESLPKEQAPRGTIGIPRGLNMYENYPMWHRFFTELGFNVVLSARSGKRYYEKGIETIPSESVCYPAKMMHGHILNLIDQGVKRIFYPSVVYEKHESNAQQNHFNCPVVASYPEVIRVNMFEQLKENDVEFMNPFLTLNDPLVLARKLFDCFPNIPNREIKLALMEASREELKFKQWLIKRGDEVLSWLEETGNKGIVFAGHPYHIDPAINHGIPEEITQLEMAVLTEDTVCDLAPAQDHKGVVNQWTYHSRLYRAADVVKKHPNLELLHVTSFGCGIDAITTDGVKDILEADDQLYTWIKMDEISNPGAARIRLRSLKAAMEERDQVERKKKSHPTIAEPPIFTAKSKKKYTILAPQMSPTHFVLLERSFQLAGYKLKCLQDVRDKDVEHGLRFVNNDACYPAIITIGQLVTALKSGEYDLDSTAVIISQTGGGCRATNYFALLKRALRTAGMSQVPVLSLNGAGFNKAAQPGFKYSISLLRRAVIGVCIGDLLERLKLAVRPYEKIKGTTEKTFDYWLNYSVKFLDHFTMKKYKQMIREIIDSFGTIKVMNKKKPKVGVVGEILIKFHPYANNQVIQAIEQEGGEAVVPDLIDFFLYTLHNQDYKSKNLGTSRITAQFAKLAIKLIEVYRNPIRELLLENGKFAAPLTIQEIAKKATQFINLGNQMGEGWLLTGEMVELMDSGVENVVCVQPFGCLPNHIMGRGMFNAIKRDYPNANIVAIDYDNSISKVNQTNRIKLMINVAKNRMKASKIPIKPGSSLNRQ